MLVFDYLMVYHLNVRQCTDQPMEDWLFVLDDNLHAYNRYGISSPRCNQTSWIAWFLLIQYFFLAKRFLTSLLTAMFG